jgi:hypothetical protein
LVGRLPNAFVIITCRWLWIFSTSKIFSLRHSGQTKRLHALTWHIVLTIFFKHDVQLIANLSQECIILSLFTYIYRSVETAPVIEAIISPLKIKRKEKQSN